MNVLYLTNNPNLGGTARILQSWLTLGNQAGLGGQVVLQRGGPLRDWLAANGVDHRVSPMRWPDRRWPLPSLQEAWALARWTRRFGADVIHCNEHDVFPFAALLRRLLNRPLVCHVRFRVTPEFCRWAFGGRRRMPDALLWTSQQQRADCIAAVGDHVPPDRQHLVYLGLDLGSFGTRPDSRDATRHSWGFAPEEIVIGTASVLQPRKRIEDFINLVARLAQEDPRVVGVIAGDADAGNEGYRDTILRQIQGTGLGRRLRWVGHLGGIEPFHHACDIFVSTSDYETFGNSVCEAMACRRPVAAYRGGSVHEVIGDTGLVVENGDVPALTAAVRRLVQDRGLRDELGERGRRRVATHFDPAASFRQLRRIYESLEARGPRSGTAARVS